MKLRTVKLTERLILGAGLLAAALAPAACHRSHVSGTVSTEAVAQAFTDVGYDAAAMKRVDPEPWGAGYCAEGTVAGLDVVSCEFEADEALAKAEQKIRDDWNAKNVDTGVVTHNARTLLSVSDQHKVDPSGRIIVRLLGAFRELH